MREQLQAKRHRRFNTISIAGKEGPRCTVADDT
jgi:hypothetical protein